ncbi:type III-B CRISPR-associated protein Cas10/Cmr2 [Allochromatium tepidum]|uniref:Type III-B CRISPR-associated protein Cas10/Cmr2 n=1 Tax=Allochromatium tepidum TaxID=553982 RepID=A0ABN6GJ00_9GAMM|nr:type III-B CRISPR-associated protein Cas10/Cmr2 [Allochromatium tepidum]BCU08375.1 type III-B CRISPR-associated protein Cas10/Cmr2 [Allochromatium tepidum]
MPQYLVTLSLGPVQSLIEAARRTRDLWCGSWLLSESARAAARVLHQAQPGCLIFPCPQNPDVELQPQQEPGDSANIANILRAEVDLPDAAAARVLCERAKQAAAQRLIDLGEQARGQLRVKLRDEVWQAQIGDLLESFAAWAEIPTGPDGYRQASARLGATLAARKATRDFRPAVPLKTPGLPKSSLDGALETVLPKPEDWPEQHRDRRKLGLSRGEQLDALGVMKRMAGQVEQFTPYSRVAADPWIRTLPTERQAALCAAYEPLVKSKLATRVSGNHGDYDALPYDAQMLYDFRLDNALAAKGEDAAEPEEREALLKLQKVMKSLPAESGAPVPYAVILKADGDRMGALLQQAKQAADSRAISQSLHGFASSVRELVRQHHGHAIYSGGDDVLALVPLPEALACARTLAEAFAKALQPVAKSLGLNAAEHPTLSVGLAIGHLMEPLGALRKRAGHAEHLAKGDTEKRPRNALAIVLGIRSGGELEWRANWDDSKALADLEAFTTAYRDGRLPSRVAYDLRAIDRRLAWMRQDDSEIARGMRKAEVARMLDRAREEGGTDELSPALRELILTRAGGPTSTPSPSLAKLADTLILARWLSARTVADLGVRDQ